MTRRQTSQTSQTSRQHRINVASGAVEHALELGEAYVRAVTRPRRRLLEAAVAWQYAAVAAIDDQSYAARRRERLAYQRFACLAAEMC